MRYSMVEEFVYGRFFIVFTGTLTRQEQLQIKGKKLENSQAFCLLFTL